MLTVIFVSIPDFVGIAAGDFFSLFHDPTFDAGILDPGAIRGDAAYAAASAAKVPVRRFAVAVTLTSVDFHVVAVAT